MKSVRWMARNHVAANLLMALFLVGGMFAAHNLKVEVFPEIELDIINITVAYPGAGPKEVFFLSGTDMRVAGVGNVSLVSGSLSTRALSGPNANRGWLSLTLAVPEPTAALGAVGALAMLGLCHGLVRRRSR